MSQKILPFDATEVTLENGLRVIVVPTGLPNLVSVQIPVQTGSRNEVEPGKSGFAHFFEHMMFRGTERYPAELYQEVIAGTGARQNAYTTDDYTNYHTTFAKEDLETVLEVEADRFMRLSYSEADFKTESRAVLGEYNKSAANPMVKLFEVQRDAAFTTHTYKHTTMGFLADIEAMPDQFAYSREFFDRWYRPEYTTVIVAGDVEPEEVVRLVEKHWGGWERGSHKAAIPAEPEPSAPVTAHVPWETPTLPWITIGFLGPAFSDTSRGFAAFDTLLDLHFGETSDLYRRLVEREQKVDQFFPFFAPRVDPAPATIMARLRDIEDMAYVRDAILETLARARTEPVPAPRLEDAKSHARYAFARALDDSETIAATLASFAHFRRSYDTVNDLFAQYDALTPDDLLAAADRFIRDERLILTTLSHEPLPSHMGEIPAIGSFAGAATSESALRVITQPSPSPMVRIKLLFETGSADDPGGREGLAALAGEMIANGGSRHHTIDEVSRLLFPMAGSLSAQVDREMTVFTAVAHREKLDEFLDIVLPQLTEPGFREDDFERLKAQQHSELIQDLRSSNEEELGKEFLQTTLFTGTTYGHPTVGTASGIDALTLEDVHQFVQQRYARSRLTVGIAGDAPENLVARLSRELAVLPAGSPATGDAISARMPHGLEVTIIDKPTRSVAMSLGHPMTVTRPHPDFAALWLARAWLGEHRVSHGQLFQRIREVRGLNYGDYAYIEAFPGAMYGFFPPANVARRAQIFEVWIRPVSPENAHFTLKLALHELRRFLRDGIPERDFETIRNYLLKNLFVMTKTQDQRLGYALDSEWHGTGEFVPTMQVALEKLTLADVNGAIQRHISADNLAIVIISANAEALRDTLLSNEAATVAYDAEKPADLVAEDEAVGALQLNLRPERVRIVPVDEVFA